MNYYPFHLGDYAAHTAHLEPMEDLAYRRMIDAYYLRECPLPSDVAEVARLIRMRANVDEVGTVLAEFFALDAEGWRHFRCDEEIVRMQDKQAKARASAFASVNARKAKASPSRNDGSTDAQRTLNERSTDVELPTPTPTPTPNIDKSASAQRAKPAVVTQPEGVSDSVWQDFLAVRKANRAPLTQTALDGIGREASKAGITLAQALSICCTRGWRSFNASWKWRDEATEQTGETPYQRSMRERVQQMAPAIASRSHLRAMPAVEFFEGQAIEVETKQLGVEP